MPLNIAIDGPVGAGKSTISDAVAKHFGILHLDTGAMYRAAGLYCLRHGADMTDNASIEKVFLGDNVQVTVRMENGAQRTLVNGEDVTAFIRADEVSLAASAVGRVPKVRERMVEIQREIASMTDMLLDGRDICLRVLPDAQVKIFLTASPEERARRRWEDNQRRGMNTPFEQVLEELKQRDWQDSHRDVDPLKPTEDATIVDTTGCTFEEAIQKIIAVVEEKRK